VFLQLSFIGLFGANTLCVHNENSDMQEVFLSKTDSILTVDNVLYAPASNTVAFLSRYTCVSSTQINRPIWSNISLRPPGKR
jgi:hypothetical protein